MEESKQGLKDAELKKRSEAYWKENIRLIITLLAIWFTVSYVPAIFSKFLNELNILTGFPLGYYMGSQGALIVFVILIFYYAYAMDKMDAKYGLKEEI